MIWLIKVSDNGFDLLVEDQILIRHTRKNPAFYVGQKDLKIAMDKGVFDIKDDTIYHPAVFQKVEENTIYFKEFTIQVKSKDGMQLQFHGLKQSIKVRLEASKNEEIYGMGEHFTSLNLRGHTVKNWIEEHITRKQIYNKIIRRLLHIKPKKWTFEEYKTYFITPSFISSKQYFCHVETPSYGLFNFRNDKYHEITILDSLHSITIKTADSLLDTAGALCQYKGLFPPLPEWVYDGLILGIQGGSSFVKEQTKKLLEEGTKITGIWAQDWCGELYTYFGKQVRWNWEKDENLYPNLKEEIKTWSQKNIQFLGYINPYLKEEEKLFEQAKTKDYLVKNKDGSIFLTQATSFKFGIIDLTNPKAYEWFKDLMKKNLVGLGMMGWMADFGEYLPTDCILYEGDPLHLHNQWPDLWIKLNKEVLEESGLQSKGLFFNRAGYSDNVEHSTLIWNGDQHVDFTDDFGMKSALRASLSLSFSGVGLSHSDVGGYTTVPGIKRSKELYLRWLEMNTFTPILRSHEGNKPKANIQPYTDAETRKATAFFSTIHAMLKPYFQVVEKEYRTKGYPMIRPTIFHQEPYKEDAFFIGQDLLVYPILNKKQRTQKIVFHDQGWTHIFTGKVYEKGEHLIDAPIGMPPVFYQEKSEHAGLFKDLTSYIQKN